MEQEIKHWAAKDGYLVNRDGTIYKMNWHRTGLMKKVKQVVDKDGYLQFGFNGKTIKSHRFVAELFISNPNSLPEVNHKNEVKDDNRVENLEWCDHKYNMNYGTRNEKASKGITAAFKKNPKPTKPVLQYTLDGKFVAEWISATEAAMQLGFEQGSICRCCNGKQKYHKEFLWKFKNQEN